MRLGNVPASVSAQSTARPVEARRTPASMGQLRAALGRALEAKTGRRPSERTLDVLSAQVSLETARGEAMFNFNFGGIKGAGPTGETANCMTREVVAGRDVRLEQGFRAYRSLDEGARDYVDVLGTRFPQAFARAVAGDVNGFAHALKQSHYYTAPEDEYAAGLRAAAGIHDGGAPAAPLQAIPELATSAELSRVLDAIASTASRIADPTPKD